MTRLEYTDGTSITLEEAAALIEAEGRLAVGSFSKDNGARCLFGALEGWSPSQDRRDRRLSRNSEFYLNNRGLGIRDNDDFKGSMKARAAHFAARFRELAQEEEA